MNQKYKVEGYYNFYEELYKSLDAKEETNVNVIENLCLISNEPLTEHFVTLDCNHKFNYLPLFNDIFNYKKKFNTLIPRFWKT